MDWTTTDGKSWKIRVEEHLALVWLHTDEKTYLTNVFLGDGSLKFPGQFDCIKEAKKACLDEIERANAQEEANKPKPSVILRGRMHYSDYTEDHETVKQAALSAYWAITDNAFFPREIEAEGKVVWMSQFLTNDEYPTLAVLAEMEDAS